MSPLPRRMLGRAASWENPQVHPSPLPEGLTYVGVAVTIRLLWVPHIKSLIALIQFNAAMDAAVQFDGTFRAERVCRGIKADDDFAAFETMAFGECVKNDTVKALGTMSIRQP